MYQVGDSVMIRPDISVGYEIDPELYINDSMVKHAGKITKIKKTCSFDEEGWFYIEADYGEYWWSTKMVIPLKQRTE